MTKLQKVKAYKYKDHNIYKFRLNIPSDVINELQWNEGAELNLRIKNKKLEVFPSKLI